MEAGDSGPQKGGLIMDTFTTLTRGREEPVQQIDEMSSRLEQEVTEVLLMDHLTECPPPPTSGFLGVLRYKRESQDQAPGTRNFLPEPKPLRESLVLCEYCGVKATPPFHPAFPEEPEGWLNNEDVEDVKHPLFCCAQHQQRCEMLAHEKRIALQRLDLENDETPTFDNQQTEEELQAQARDKRKADGKQREQLYHEIQPTLPSGDNFTPFCTTISFLLSTCTLKATITQHSSIKENPEKQQGQLLSDHASSKFGKCSHQEGAGLLEKYYTCGRKFLTILPDGTAQVFYPSGNLALIIISDERRKVCIVHDDCSHSQPIRALFQSDGRATCYHSNGNVWLSLDTTGGQCLNDTGARTKRWYWGSHGHTTPLRPVFLSLNHSLGVRVLGQGDIFVSFLAGGQQAKFSVGAHVQPVAREISNAPGLSTSKEELFLMAGRIQVHQIIQQLHHCLSCRSNQRPRRSAPTPRLRALAKKLLNLSCSICLEESEKAFVHRCLEDCL